MEANAIISSNLSKSEKVRRLYSLGWSIKTIANTLDIGYGFTWVVVNKRSANITQVVTAFLIDTIFTRRFGIEIEGYGVSHDQLKRALESAGVNVSLGNRSSMMSSWKITTDSSIRGLNSFELVSPILEGERGIEELRKVSRVLISCRVKINKSCGLHVHFDARNMGLEVWKRLYKNYIKLEQVIDSMMPLSRRADSNHYCQSLKKNANIETVIDGCRTVSDIAQLYDSRYYKVNANSFSVHNTVEFRQHSGTIEIEKMENWIRFLDALVKYSEREVVSSSDFENLKNFCCPELVESIYGRIQILNS